MEKPIQPQLCDYAEKLRRCHPGVGREMSALGKNHFELYYNVQEGQNRSNLNDDSLR